ncbi:capsular polysaccharide biosynthesis protein [Escherichia coli O136]|uniref:capsular polysaccharide biosynthesis protein n=1 Tax=Escherichia coli TaxID=562 RepID=UPI0002AA8A8E|nr:capsular polysaccharide biosynthesis protein [Escherichia coli]EEZ9025883.1 capsular polysaccharide biosynthesis protein [Escherichia coli O136]EIH10749.1 capsule polysaccharide biosynthesis protein [Escherichia coli 97.0259]MBS6210689.1 capsular polysaccharide biosynthesis protein [Proteus hauseri]EEY3927654.1 capsular polysaccharide biosynthesis protein [Escherichia coli]EEY8846237.1 capsular polysaccharide biosynthesis protein [Escherichia coli]
MILYTNSKGILAKKYYIQSILNMELRYLKKQQIPDKNSVFIGWGQKDNTRKIKSIAEKWSAPYWQLEDGFIGYIGHPGRTGKAVSLIADPIGIYYDARQPSQLENLIASPIDRQLIERAEHLIKNIVRLGITKYNCYAQDSTFDNDNGIICNSDNASIYLSTNTQPLINDSFPSHNFISFVSDSKPRILLVDQVLGDLSIQGAMASEDDFLAMVVAARRNHPNARILLRTHPDTRFSKKRGVLASLVNREPILAEVEVVSDSIHPHKLLNTVDAVYTVSSQVGFEALLLGKKVYCFGMPFYAGWGLTHDSKKCARRQEAMSVYGFSSISLPQLVAAALIRYPYYFDPILEKCCEVEDVIDIIAHQQVEATRWRRLYLVGFSLWKRSFMRTFCAHLAKELCFVSSLPPHLKDDEHVLVWGNSYPELQSVIRVEDGFIRSNGLGSNFCRPSSLCIDPVGIYFNSFRPSKLEQLLNTYPLDNKTLIRGNALLRLLRSSRVSKYNVGVSHEFHPPQDGRELVLVVGQVDGDASILYGSPFIRSNEQLLWAVRKAKPNAHILFKPHPDVISGNRKGAVSAKCQSQCVDSLVIDIELASLYPHIDELHTMTSLSGFEALVQGVNVITWGQPFYSGWGLTQDIYPPTRRQRTLTLSALVYITLTKYPRYIDWKTGLWCSSEQLIHLMAGQNKTPVVGLNRWRRWRIKFNYLFQSLK